MIGHVDSPFEDDLSVLVEASVFALSIVDPAAVAVVGATGVVTISAAAGLLTGPSSAGLLAGDASGMTSSMS